MKERKHASFLYWILLGLGAGACLAAAWFERQLFLVAYLEAYLLVLGIALGSMLILLIHQLVGGHWGFRIQNFLLAAVSTLPWLLLLHIPLWLSMDRLYIWAGPTQEDMAALIARKRWYLNDVFFYVRSAIFWCAWLGIGFLLRRQIQRQRQMEKPVTNRSLGSWALMLTVLTISFAAVDWVMSLEPRFYSSIFGLIILVGFMLSAFAWVIIARQCFRPDVDLATADKPDLGNLLLMSVMLWAYGSYSQLLLIWSGQLPEEILFYQTRFHPPWQALGWALIGFGFVLPFLLLLSRRNKTRPWMLVSIAALALFGHWLDLIWNIQPIFTASWMLWLSLSVLASATLGGFWLLIFRHSLGKEPHGKAV